MSNSVVPLNALNRLPPDVLNEVVSAVEGVVRSGWYALGDNVSAFERAFAEFCGVESVIGVANGTDALELSMRAVGCQQGDRIAMVANAGMYAAAAALSCGARPLFVDVSADTMTMDPDALEHALSETGAKAVVVTHLYGQLAAMGVIQEIVRRAGAALIEDCAQAHGAMRDGRRAGSFGDIAAFSFYPTKNLGAMGDAGAVATSDNALAMRVRRLRQYGWAERYRAIEPFGRNSRLDEIQAAILLVLLRRLPEWTLKRREIANRIAKAANAGSALRLPTRFGEDHVSHILVGVAKDREHVRARLSAFGISTDVHYPIPDHRQPALEALPESRVRLPVTEALTASVVTLPCFPTMTEHEIERVERAVSLV
jgi:dTDP-4-amino-4,6-dideoxygalactose transaminase